MEQGGEVNRGVFKKGRQGGGRFHLSQEGKGGVSHQATVERNFAPGLLGPSDRFTAFYNVKNGRHEQGREGGGGRRRDGLKREDYGCKKVKWGWGKGKENVKIL